MASVDDCPCSSGTVGHPTSGPICPFIEYIKTLTPSTASRPVRLEFRFAKNKQSEGFRATAHRKWYEMTGKAFEPALHWAVQIGSKCFDLHRVPFTKDAELRTTDWETSSIRYEPMKERSREIGLTHLTDNQIEYIGNHIIEKAFPKYDALISNCQSFVIELCKKILQERNNELYRLWVGYQVYEFFNHLNKAIGAGLDKVAGGTRALEDLSVVVVNRNLRGLMDMRGSVRRIKASWKAGLITARTGASQSQMGALMKRLPRMLRQ